MREANASQLGDGARHVGPGHVLERHECSQCAPVQATLSRGGTPHRRRECLRCALTGYLGSRCPTSARCACTRPPLYRAPVRSRLLHSVSAGTTAPMASRQERIAEIEVLFRAGNERMMAWPENQERAALGERLVLFCECGRRRCPARLQLTAAEYEAVRADASRFVVAQGHEFAEAEDVVEEHEGYVVVRKHDDVRALVERMDFRRSDADDP
jgi:hypothetical protein